MEAREAQDIARRLLGHLEAAWNRADGAGYGAAFTEDAEFVDIRGMLHRGRGAIAGGHQGIFDTVYKGSTVRHVLAGARAVAPGVIVAHGVAHLAVPNGMFAGRHAINTLVLVSVAGEWRVASFHNAVAEAGIPAPAAV